MAVDVLEKIALQYTQQQRTLKDLPSLYREVEEEESSYSVQTLVGSWRLFQQRVQQTLDVLGYIPRLITPLPEEYTTLLRVHKCWLDSLAGPPEPDLSAFSSSNSASLPEYIPLLTTIEPVQTSTSQSTSMYPFSLRLPARDRPPPLTTSLRQRAEVVSPDAKSPRHLRTRSLSCPPPLSRNSIQLGVLPDTIPVLQSIDTWLVFMIEVRIVSSRVRRQRRLRGSAPSISIPAQYCKKPGSLLTYLEHLAIPELPRSLIRHDRCFELLEIRAPKKQHELVLTDPAWYGEWYANVMGQSQDGWIPLTLVFSLEKLEPTSRGLPKFRHTLFKKGLQASSCP